MNIHALERAATIVITLVWTLVAEDVAGLVQENVRVAASSPAPDHARMAIM